MFRCIVVCAVLSGALCFGQEEDLRSAEIERRRQERVGKLTPDEPEPLEQRIRSIRKNPILNGILGGRNGFQLTIGRMIPGAGFALGPQYTSPELFGGRLSVRVRGAASTRRFFSGAVDADLPYLWDGNLFIKSTVGYRDYAAVDYFGPGPDSKRTGRSNYRLEAMNVDLRPGFRLNRRFSIGAVGGFQKYNVGPGARDQFISTELQYPPSLTPGIDVQSDFVKAGGFAVYDRRVGGSEPLGGGRYSLEYARLHDRGSRGFTHNRLEADIQQYLPFFNDRRIIALHAATILTYSPEGNNVPFYMQPVLGGGDDLRGFRPFRFYGDNAFWMNAEYRWETGLAMDMVFFADAGKVFDRRSQLNFHDLELSPGFGFRFKARHNMLVRLDTAFSHEGFQIWFRFTNIF